MAQVGSQESMDKSVSPHWEFATTTGTSLPSNFAGVTELLPSVLYSLDKGFDYFRLETKYFFANSDGVSLRRAYLNIKNYVEVFDMKYFWSFGLGLTEFSRQTIDYNDASPLRVGGWHYAMGTKVDINKKVFVRAEVGAFIQPGRTIYVGIGFGLNFGSESR